MGRFIIKHIDNRKPQVKNNTVCVRPSVSSNIQTPKVEEKIELDVVDEKKEEITPKVENNVKEEVKVMTTSEKVAMAQSVLSNTRTAQVKRVKRDKGLIERAESSKTILTEDNKELLND